MSCISNTSLDLERGGPRGETRGKRENAQMTVDQNHRQELGLKSSVSGTPMFLVFIPNLSFLEGRGRVTRYVVELPLAQEMEAGRPDRPRRRRGRPDIHEVAWSRDESD